jgi:phage terminase large subunit
MSRELILNPAFEPLFSDTLNDPRYYQVYGGRGSGKSFTVSIALVQKTYSKFKHKILYLRQTMSSSEDSTIADIRSAIEFMGVEADFKYKAGLFTNKKTGATITFKGIRSTGSQSAKLKSLSGITTLVFEEAEEIESFEEFSKVDESIRLKGKPLKVILVYNPTQADSSWIHKEWFKRGVPKIERSHDTVYMHSTYLDNVENLDAGTVRRYMDLEKTSPIYYRNTILAEWTLEAVGRVYEGWGRYEFFEDVGDVWYGLDFAYGGKDHTSCVKINYFEGVYYVEQVFSKPDLTATTIRRELINAGVPFNAEIFADYAMPIFIRELVAKGYRNVKKCSAKSKVTEAVKLIQDKEICIIGPEDTELYYGYLTWAFKGGKLPHEPDPLAALRYGINSKVPSENPQGIAPRRAKRTRGFL